MSDEIGLEVQVPILPRQREHIPAGAVPVFDADTRRAHWTTPEGGPGGGAPDFAQVTDFTGVDIVQQSGLAAINLAGALFVQQFPAPADVYARVTQITGWIDVKAASGGDPAEQVYLSVSQMLLAASVVNSNIDAWDTFWIAPNALVYGWIGGEQFAGQLIGGYLYNMAGMPIRAAVLTNDEFNFELTVQVAD